MIEIKHKEDCCGCTACKSICPQQCISMEVDNEGFTYPCVNQYACIGCNLCEKVCPIVNKKQIHEKTSKAYVVQNKDKEVLKNSTSGGFIDVINKYTIEQLGGYAVGVIFDNNFMPVHKIAHTYEGAQAFRSSKYAQSDLKKVFIEIKKLLQKDNYVVFTGTPCQVAGLRSYLEKEYDKLILIDLVCRSIPSPKLWSEYLEWQKKRYKSNILSINCRNKTYGYHSGSLVIHFENGKNYSGSNRIDPYMKAFHQDICSRPSCYKCQFKTKHRCSDYTVFDSWKPEIVSEKELKDNNLGYSNVIIHSQKGMELFVKLGNIDYYPANQNKMFLFTGKMESESIMMKNERKQFYLELEEYGFSYIMKKFVKISLLDRLIEKVKPIRYFIKGRKQ